MHTLEQLRSGALAGTRRLDLCADLTTLPPEVLDLADTLEVLNLSGNRLTTLPHGLGRLRHLKVLFASGNPFTHLPEVLGDCPALEMVGFKACRLTHVPEAALPPRLRWLTLTDNSISGLPRSLGERSVLQKLMLAGNLFTQLPPGLAGAKQLELIRLSANRLAHLPGWLTELPALAWLALSGNPLGWPQAAQPQPLPAVPWARLRLGEQLGEGASGQIHRAGLTPADWAQVWGAAHGPGVVATLTAQQGQPCEGGTVCEGDERDKGNPGGTLALKLFKGAVTSDGLPEHELAACRAAGQHPALCTPVAELAGHPQGLAGLLLPLIPPSHTNLAGPPSLQSCTRDVYPEDLRLGPGTALHLARQVAQAVAHMHAHGVVHGDLYAHNILWDPASGQALLSDFGAATLLPAHDPVLSLALQAVEVRAFGVLLAELLARVQPGDGAAQAWPPTAPAGQPMPAKSTANALAGLALACLSPRPSERPRMAEVVSLLGGLA